MEATLPGGRKYVGTYAQIRMDTSTDTTGPYLIAWSQPAWAGEPWYSGPPEEFAAANRGRVLALLNGSDGTKMRCKFQLHSPDSGLAGGGTGTCQTSDRENVFDAKLKADGH